MDSLQPSGRYSPPPDLSKYGWLSVGAALLTISLKGGAAWLTGSVSLLSDAAESVVNLVAAIVALYALKLAIKPPDRGHPFGHNKVEYLSAALEGIMIFAAASFIIAASIERIMSPRLPERLGLGMIICLLASVVNGAVSFVLLRAGRRYDSTTLIADGKHLMTDVVTSAAVLLGVGLVAITHQPILDPIVALLAGLNILWTGFGLVRQSINGLMDVSVPDDVHSQLVAVLDGHRSPERIEFHAIRTRQSGQRQFMEFHVLVPGEWSVSEGHTFTEQVIDDLVAAVPAVRVTAHLEPIEDPLSYADLEY